MEISLENLYVDIGLKGLRSLGGLINRGAYNLKRESSSKQALPVLIKIRFAFTQFLKLRFKTSD